MKRLMSGALLLGALYTAAACNNVTGDLAKGATRVLVDPNPLVADTNSDHTFVVQVFDDQGSPLISAATIGAVTPITFGGTTGGATIVLDTSYQTGGVHYSTQFKVHGTALGLVTYLVTDNGLTTTDTAFVLPPVTGGPSAIVTPILPTMGDALVITIPANQPYRFTDSSQVFIGPITVANNQMQLDSVSIDSLTGYFTVNGASAGFVTITKTQLNFAARTGLQWRTTSTDTVAVLANPVATLNAIPDTLGAPPAGNDLTWNRVRGVTPYRILRATAVGGPYAIIDSTLKDVDTVFTDAATTVSGTTYFYKIRACTASRGCAADSPASPGSAAE